MKPKKDNQYIYNDFKLKKTSGLHGLYITIQPSERHVFQMNMDLSLCVCR